MDFYSAIKEARVGKNIQRLEWHDSEWGHIKKFSDGEFLCIHKDSEDHVWKVSVGDIDATDWVAF